MTEQTVTARPVKHPASPQTLIARYAAWQEAVCRLPVCCASPYNLRAVALMLVERFGMPIGDALRYLADEVVRRAEWENELSLACGHAPTNVVPWVRDELRENGLPVPTEGELVCMLQERDGPVQWRDVRELPPDPVFLPHPRAPNERLTYRVRVTLPAPAPHPQPA